MKASRDAPAAESRLSALPPEERERIGTAMKLRLDFENLLLEALNASYDLMAGKAPAPDVAKGLIDLQHSVRQRVEASFRRPLKAAHAMAVLSGETKLDEEAWLKRMRIEAAQARIEREESARVESFRASMPSRDESTDEPEAGGPRP